MIYYFVPYSTEKNLGKAYNQHMTLLPKDDDWGVLMDGDIMFLTFDWGHQIAKAIEDNPDAGIISCYTNRISKRKAQLYEVNSPNILVHREQATRFNAQFRGSYKKISQNVSGFLMIIKKKTWKDAGKFPELKNTILDIDGLFSRRIRNLGKSIVLMRGIYVFHYYRMAEGRHYRDHLREAKLFLDRTSKKRNARNNKNMRNLNVISRRRKQRIKTRTERSSPYHKRNNGRSLHINRL